MLIFTEVSALPQYFRRITRPAGPAGAAPGAAAAESPSKKGRGQLWSAVATIVLIEGRGLVAMDDNGLSDPYIKFKLGNERYKTKVGPLHPHVCW